MSRKIDKLQPWVQEPLKAALSEMDVMGIKYSIQSTLRTAEEQAAYFAQGRQALDVVNSLREKVGFYKLAASENTYTITKCDGINNKSNHQSGLAVDIVPVDTRGNPIWPELGAGQWLPISDCMKRHGFSWGGDWKNFPDAPHYEYPNKGSV